MFVDATDKLTNHQPLDEIHLGGTAHLMTQPEFRDPSHFSEVLHMVEDTTPLREWISNTELGEGIVITIGRELKAMDLQLCAMVTSSYRVGQVHGTIGVIGPTRMPYSKLVSVVDYTSRLLTEVLSRG
jgi:heat-inducible transcriptional repressor